MFLAGVPMPMFNVPTTTLLQEMVDPDMQGRVFGVMQLITTTVLPLGMLVFGPLADFVSIEILLILASGLMAIPGVWIFFNKQPDKPGSRLPAEDFEMQPGD
jgi:DHA3 family macrolide efflux protein-like MFS transporter